MTDKSVLDAIGALFHCPKGEYLFKQGDLDKSVYVVKSGLLKAHYLTIDGKELIKSFIQEG